MRAAEIVVGGEETMTASRNRMDAAAPGPEQRKARQRFRLRAYGARYSKWRGPGERGEDGELTRTKKTS